MAAFSGAPGASYNLEFPMLLKLMELNFKGDMAEGRSVCGSKNINKVKTESEFQLDTALCMERQALSILLHPTPCCGLNPHAC